MEDPMSETRGARARLSRMTGRRAMRRPVALLLVALLGVGSACTADGHGSVEATAVSSPADRPTQSPGPVMTQAPAGRPALPSGFPVAPGAVAVPVPEDDRSVVARWMLPEVGSGPYDYYLEALPAAGFPIVGRYPADQAALVRFEIAPGTIWQLVLEHADAGTRVTLQTDRP
jgi:hypothetical protein